jgi:myosin heavy subunit
LAILNDE